MGAIELCGALGRAEYTSEVPFDERRVGAAAVYCSDGRYGEQMDEFLHLGLGLPRYDRVAVPGGAGCLAGHSVACQEKWAMEKQLEFLIKAHALTRVVLIAHDGCGFYKELWKGLRSAEEQQGIDLEKAAERIRMWKTGLEVEAYFARRVDGRVVFERWNTGERAKPPGGWNTLNPTLQSSGCAAQHRTYADDPCLSSPQHRGKRNAQAGTDSRHAPVFGRGCREGHESSGRKVVIMTTIHAWFSAEAALTHGSCVYRKPDGSTVNVTRMSAEFKDAGWHRPDEKYLGQVMSREDGGCVKANSRVRGITD
jgi:hypothetical protein